MDLPYVAPFGGVRTERLRLLGDDLNLKTPSGCTTSANSLPHALPGIGFAQR